MNVGTAKALTQDIDRPTVGRHKKPRRTGVVVARAVAVPVLAGALSLGVTSTAEAAGKTLRQGTVSADVAKLQRYLDTNKRADYFSYSGDYTKKFGPATNTALRKWEKANKRKVDGKITVGSAEWKQLASQVKQPKIDKRCKTGAFVLCASKKDRRLYVVKNGKIDRSYSARFGRKSMPTREGTFHIFRISGKNARSSVYHTPMPYAMTFSGGQAVHYSPDFARNGYNGASHGCINLRDYAGTKWINSRVKIGTKVVVYK